MIEHNLTEKQLRFAEEYIKEPNATKAYMTAYPSVKKESTANANGSRMLRNAKVSAYIDERMKRLQSERIADATEVLETLTAVLRGQKRGTALVGAGMGEQDVVQVEPTVAEKIRAAELLGKRYKLFTDKAEVEMTGTVQFIDDISGDDE